MNQQQHGPNWLRTLVLLGVCSALGLGYIGYEYGYKPRKEDQEESDKRLFVLDDKSVEAIEVTGGGRSFSFRCLDLADKMCKSGDQSDWELTEPMKTSADKANVNSILSSIKNLTATDTVDLAEETAGKRSELLTNYGLDESARSGGRTQKLTLQIEGKSQSVHLGGTHPIGGKIFAVRETNGKVDDSKVFLLPSYFKSNFEKDLTYWRNKDLVKFSAHRIASFNLVTPRIDAEIAKVQGSWDLKVKESGGRVSYAGDVENVDGVLTSINYLKAKSFASEDKTSSGARAILAKSRKFAEITVKPKDKSDPSEAGKTDESFDKPFTVTFYEQGKDEAEKVYATVSHLDPVFELEKGAKKRVDKTLKDLRQSRLITAMQRFSAKRLAFAGKGFGGGDISVKRDDNDKWVYEKGGEKDQKPSETRIDRVLDQLSGNHIKEFIPASKIPSGDENGVILSVGDETEPEKTQIVFWKKGETLYARDLKSKRNEAFELASSVGEALPWDKASVAKDPEKVEPAEAGDDGHGHGPDDGHGH